MFSFTLWFITVFNGARLFRFYNKTSGWRKGQQAISYNTEDHRLAAKILRAENK